MYRVFQKNEGKLIIAIMGMAIIVVVGFLFADFIKDRKFVEKAAMAENYLKAGSYEQAIEAYEQALSMKNGDEELLTVGLAKAYADIRKYDKALEVLRSCYQKTSGRIVKEKIEEIITEKTDYEYLQSICRAEVYFKNQEYVKAIEEYDKAKQIKSKDIMAYQGIADSYIKMGEYALAKEEVVEGQAITLNKKLEFTLAVIDSHLRKEEYDTLLKQATEYISQENYVDGVAKFEEAIALIPMDSEAYSELAQMYLSIKKYEKAIAVLTNAMERLESTELKNLLMQIEEEKALEDEKNKLLNRLYYALMNENMEEVTITMKAPNFREDFDDTLPVFYPVGESDEIDGKIMAIYDNRTVYYGEFSDGKRQGIGIYFTLTEGKYDTGIYYYKGYWLKDIPNGIGKTVEEKTLVNDKDEKYISITTTEGSFVNAVEDGRMTKIFNVNGEDAGKLLYTASKGVPVPLASEKKQNGAILEDSVYEISILSLDNIATGEFYRIEPQTIWGVKPFLNK